MTAIKKILYLSPHNAYYRTPLLNKLSLRKDISLSVVNLRPSSSTGLHDDESIKEDYPTISLRYRIEFRKRVLHPEISHAIRDGGFDIVVISSLGDNLTNYIALLHCIAFKVKYIYSADTVTSSNVGIKDRLRASFNKVIAKNSIGIFVPGAAAKKYWMSLGVKEARIGEGAYTIPAEIFGLLVDNKRQANIGDNGLKKDMKFLMVGNLIPSRCHVLLIDAFYEVIKVSPDCQLFIVGRGSEYQNIINLIEELDISKFVKLLGYVPHDRLTEVYADCDVYLHSGSEPYSTAIAYAAASALPIIASKEVGATADYIKHGLTGLSVENTKYEFARAIHYFLKHKHRIREMGEAAKDVALSRSLSFAEENFCKLCNLNPRE